MNIERIKKLAEVLRSPVAQDHFDMSDYFFWDLNVEMDEKVSEAIHKCGTTACIAGWAVTIFAPDTKVNCGSEIHSMAQELLDLTTAQAVTLFLPESMKAINNINPVTAAKVLDDLAETGEVMWTDR